MVFDKVRSIISEQFDVEEDLITMDTTFDELGADSLDVVELLMAIEGEFDIEIQEGKAESITTVGELVNCIEKLS